MNTNTTSHPDGLNQPANEKENATTEDVQISLPQTDRQEGPFKHSGETARWTAEEEAEKAGSHPDEKQ